jgi:uncharacterized protein with GYD domain
MKSVHKDIIITITIIIAVVSLIVTSEFRSCVIPIFNVIYSKLMVHPFFWGVMISWLVAVISTFLVLFIAYINRGKKEQYKEIFRQSEKWLRMVTVVVLFYIAIHLASKAFWTKDKIPIGIPIFGEPYAGIVDEPYAKLDFFKYISPQDIVLSLSVIFIIISIFWIAPYFIRKHKNIILASLSISFALSILFAFCIYKYPSFVPSIPEPSQMAVSSEQDLLLFGITFVVSLILYLLIRKIVEIPKGIKDDFGDLWLIFCFIPAIIVASLVLAGDELVKFPNVFGNVVVGLVLISGFATLMSMVTISFKQETVSPWRNPVWLRSTFTSLVAISFFSMVFLLLRPILQIDIFGKALSFSVAIIILILLYGFLYEKLQKYHFTEWWRREWRPIVMIISIVLIAIVTAFDPVDKLWKIPSKLFGIGAVLLIGVYLPWIIMKIRILLKKQRRELSRDLLKSLKKLLKGEILPMHQGMVLVKAKTDPGSLKEVVKGLDGMEGVYQTMVVRGEYDVCLTVEGVDSYDIEKKILEIRKIYGVASTTTLTDIREFFDREVR